jgi:hypothetical protein
VRTYEFNGDGIAALRVVEDSLFGAGWNHNDLFEDMYSRAVVKWSLYEVLETQRFSIDNEMSGRGQRINNASNHVATIGK